MRHIRPILIICLIGLISLIGLIISLFRGSEDASHPEEAPKGTLILNTDKSVYSPDDRVYIQITSLDAQEKTDCNSKLELQVDSGQRTVDSDNTKPVTRNPENSTPITVHLSPSCGSTGLNPDYTAFYDAKDEGDYSLTLTNKDTGDSTEVNFSVSLPTTHNLSLIIWGPTKVEANPNKRYPMKLIVKANEDFSGTVVEQIPNNLKVVWYGPASVEPCSTSARQACQTITWNVDLKAGEEKELTYEYSVPEEKTGIFKLGKAKIIENDKIIFEENSAWDIVPSII